MNAEKEKRKRPLAVVAINTNNKTRIVRNVASTKQGDSSFFYSCTINGNSYQCELDTAASDIFLSQRMEEEWKLPITPKTNQVTLGDGTSVSTIGTITAAVKVGPQSWEETIHILDNHVDTGVLTLGRRWWGKH